MTWSGTPAPRPPSALGEERCSPSPSNSSCSAFISSLTLVPRLGEGLAGGGIASCWGKTTDYMDLVQTCKGPGAGDPPCEVQRPRDPLKAPTH